MNIQNKKMLTGAEFDAKFDSGESLEGYVNWSKATKIVNVSLPIWVVKALDQEAQRIGIDRQAVIKSWIVQRLDENTSHKKAV